MKYDDESENSQNKKSKGNILTLIVYLVLISIVIGLFVIVLSVTIDHSSFSVMGSIASKSDRLILKPFNDFRKYRVLKLKNGLEAVIISDPLTVTSGASLSVKVGANNDPHTLQGLAHFCEHMLFLGSKKYPNGDDYFKTITENNGHFNAYTDREITNFFFDIHYFSFDNALDIFSRFFIDPLFTEDKLFKEVNSVNSEFEKNLIIDSRKRAQILSYISNPDNPFHRFTTGNIQTLVKNAEFYGMNLRDEILKFHKKYYTADKMKLVVYTNEELDDMEELIVEKFMKIKSSFDYNIASGEYNTTSFNNSDVQVIKNSETHNKKHVVNHNIHHKKIAHTKMKHINNKNISDLNVIDTHFNPPPFSKNDLGNFITFDALNLEHELSIVYLQSSLREYYNFYHNPFYYFAFILENKDENSLIDILKKKQLASKLSVSYERDYQEWSDFVLTLSLTKQGIDNLDEVLKTINSYITFMKNKLINKKYYDFLKKVGKLNFEYKALHSSNVFEIVSKFGAKIQKSPAQYVLDDIHLINNFNSSLLHSYADNLKFDNSLIFIPKKLTENKTYSFLINTSKKNDYEPWYRTNFTIFKIDSSKLLDDNSKLMANNKNNHKQPNLATNLISKDTFSEIKLTESHNIDKLINRSTLCDQECINNLKKLTPSEPSLLNKTNTFEFWYKFEQTLDFQKTAVDLQFQFDKFSSDDDRIHILLLETMIRRKLKKINTKLKFFTNTLITNHNRYGLKLSFNSFNSNVEAITKEIVEKIHFLSLSSIKDKSFLKEFNLIIGEVQEHLKRDYNAQPYVLSYEYLKKKMLNEYFTTEEYIQMMPKVTTDTFLKFIENFNNNFYFKILIIGDLSENQARNIFNHFTPLLKINQIKLIKNFTFSLEEKRKNRKIVMKLDDGNYLLKKDYHLENNKNNVLLKCYKIGKKDYKREIMVKLFNAVIGNIVFRELRINKQYGYVAKSKIEIFETYYVSYLLTNIVLLHLCTRIFQTSSHY